VSLVGLVLTPLRPATALVRPVGAAVRPAAVALRPNLLPGLITQAAEDIHSIASSTRELTVAIDELAAIRSRVESLEIEVTRMRAAVEVIGGEVAVVRESTQPLGRLAARLGRRRRGA
jgi:hypothetical protein